ncbi:hypothetical protein RN001_007515 [Aquatica leii]|uniref:Cytochrome P450 n=1 Tax=Aquatica leii TaxID=1421715 RepID=A0AAN7P8V0_9COLE|nr:hypothetical protein RN001_007515 [Aquatica leii]
MPTAIYSSVINVLGGNSVDKFNSKIEHLEIIKFILKISRVSDANMEVTLTIIIILIVYFLTQWYIKTRRYIRLMKKFPHPPTVPLLGNALDFKSPTDFIPKFAEYTKLYGDKVKIYLGIMPEKLLVTDARLIMHILSSSNNLKKGKEYNYFSNWLGKGLLLSDGDSRWKKHRRLIASTFHIQIFKGFIEIFESNAKILVNKLENEVENPSFDIYPFITLCALDNICETVMGTSICAQNNCNPDYVNNTKLMCKVFIKRAFNAFLRTNFWYKFSSLYLDEKRAVKVLHNYTKEIIKNRKNQYHNNVKNVIHDSQEKTKVVLMDLLLQQNEKFETFTDVEIREEVDTFMFAGSDTTASALTFAIYCLAENHLVQVRVVEELNKIFGDDPLRPITFNDIQSMKYLEAVIKEVLRVYPPVPYYSRTSETEINFDDYIIPKDTCVLMNIYGVHHDPKLFPDPESFKPERFLSKNIDEGNNYGYFPFSSGPRNCIGQKFAMLEIKTALAVLLRHYEFTQSIPKHYLHLSTETVLLSNNGISRVSDAKMQVMLTIIIILFVYVLTQWYIKNRRYIQLMNKFPNPPTIPLLGNALDFKSPTDFIPKFAEYTKLYGDKVKIYVGIMPAKLLVTDVRLILHMLSSSNNLKKGREYNFFSSWLGKGLLLSDGDSIWKKHRRLIASTFHIQLFIGFIKIFESNTKILVNKLENEIGNPSFDIYPYISLWSLDNICETVMGTSICAQNNCNPDYVNSVKFMCKVFVKRSFNAFLRTNFWYKFSSLYHNEKRAIKVLHNYTKEIIRNRKIRNQTYVKNVNDDSQEKTKVVLMDLLLEQNEKFETFTDVEIREEVDTFMFAGSDTTASALTFAIYCLAENHLVQVKVVEELIEIFGDDPFRPITFNDIQSMKYLEAVVKEVLRLYPPVPYYSRTSETEINFDDYIIPKDTSVLMNIYGVHHDPKLFPDPESFKPERFLSKNIDEGNNYGYFPFSYGPRNCIGQKFAMLEIKTALAVLLRHYEFTQSIPKHFLHLSTETVLLSNNGLNTCMEQTEENRPNSRTSVDKLLTTACKLHGYVNKLAFNVNKTFSGSMFATTSTVFLDLIASIVLRGQLVDGDLWVMVYINSVYAIPAYTTILLGEMIEREDARLKWLLCNLTDSYFDSDLSDKRSLFCYQILHEPIEVSSGGFYSLNAKMVTSNIGLFCTLLMSIMKMRNSIYD